MLAESVRASMDMLSRVALFSFLSQQELEGVAGLLVPEHYGRGETVCREGEPGDALHVILSGELEVTAGEDQRLLNRMGPGEVFGEISMMLGGNRAATVTASRSSELLAFSRADFEQTCLDNPKVLEYISRVLSRRLEKNTRGGQIAKPLTTVLVTGEPGIKGRTIVASALAAFIGDIVSRDVLLVRFQRGAGKSGELSLAGLARAPADRLLSAVKRPTGGAAVLTAFAPRSGDENEITQLLSQFLDRATESFAYVILDLGTESELLVGPAREASDFHVCLVRQSQPGPPSDGGGSSRVFEVLNLHHRDSRAIPINHCEPFVLPEDPALHDLDLESLVAYLQEHPRSPAAPPLRRLARKILGVTVGIAVGGGAAFGISHVGVLLVFEENDIPVDLVAGTSMGSIVGLGYASGMTPSEMLEIARERGNVKTTLSALDFTLTRPGLLAGDRLIEIFAPLSSARDFEDLLLPCRTVATDIESGECVSIGSGPIDLAFRASCSIPLIWTPVRHQGHVFVDGAMTNPVPADVVRKMGGDVCIAINVVPSLRKGVDTVISRVMRTVGYLNPLSYLGGSRDLPNTFDTIMNSIQQLQHELGHFRAISADVRINPDLSEFTWTEFYKPMEFIERGREAAEQALPEIRRVLAERSAHL